MLRLLVFCAFCVCSFLFSFASFNSLESLLKIAERFQMKRTT